MAHPPYDLERGQRPSGRTGSLRRLSASLDSLVATRADPAAVAARAGMLLRSALPDASLLEAQHREPADAGYQQHLVHVHPSGSYSIVALVWKPGQATPIHDHRCWCVVGVWKGVERETSFHFEAVVLAPGGSAAS